MYFSQQVSLASKTYGMHVLSGTSPNAVVFGDALYAFYMGSGKDGVWYTTSTGGQSWGPIQSVRQKTPGMNTLSKTSPSAAVLGNTLYLFYNGSGGDGIWYTTTTDGESWSPVLSVRQEVPAMNVMGGTSPNAVVLGDTLYLFYTGKGGDGIWCTTTTDGQSWTPVQWVQERTPGMQVMSSTSPNAVVLGSTLYLFYTGDGGDGIWYTTTTDGQSWSPVLSVWQKSPGMNVEDYTSAAAVVVGGRLFLFYVGSGGGGMWYTVTADGESWSPVSSMANDMDGGVHGVLSGTSPWAVWYGGLPYLFWNGAGGDGVFYTAEASYAATLENLDTIIDNIRNSREFVVATEDVEDFAHVARLLGSNFQFSAGVLGSADAENADISVVPAAGPLLGRGANPGESENDSTNALGWVLGGSALVLTAIFSYAFCNQYTIGRLALVLNGAAAMAIQAARARAAQAGATLAAQAATAVATLASLTSQNSGDTAQIELSPLLSDEL